MDVFTAEKRSWIMSRVRAKDTSPELAVRSMVHRIGFRFRLHRSDLPGRPDLVFPKHRKVIFVHGCFWHGHKGCPRSKLPKTNREFWREKISRNIERDQQACSELSRMGWDVLVVWECQVRKPQQAGQLIEGFMRER